jgi:hypothetical protein
MKIAVVAPAGFIGKIDMVLDNEFNQIEHTDIAYREYAEIADKLLYRQKEFDAVLFAGRTLYNYAIKHMDPVVTWEYIPRHGSSLLTTLLKASQLGYDINRASFDSYQKEALYETYKEIDVDSRNLSIYITPERPFEDDYFDNVFMFHKKNYMEGKVSCCITALLDVNKRLKEQHIPCVFIEPTISAIRETLETLHLKHVARESQNSQIVVLAININMPDEYSLLNDNEYQFVLDRMRVSEQIYLFAQRIHAAVLETGNNDYVLFSTRNVLEIETDNFNRIALFDSIKKETLSSISVGVGYGQTVREAKYNANQGMIASRKLGKNAFCIVYGSGKKVGPIEYHGKIDPDRNRIDSKILKVAEASGISVNSVFKLYSIVSREKKDRFTAKELALLFGVSPRSMNRIIKKLEVAGYAKEVGRKVMSDAGRPSRIISMTFE